MNDEELTFEDWIKTGLEKGWVGPPVCVPHDGVPMSAEEDEAYDNGEDPCYHVVRLYDDLDVKRSVEENHSPSVWRATSYGVDLESNGE
jgi:hypothetical protein